MLRAVRATLFIIEDLRPQLAEDIEDRINRINAILNRQIRLSLTQRFEGPFVGSCEQQLSECQGNVEFCRRVENQLLDRFLVPMLFEFGATDPFLAIAQGENVPGVRRLRERIGEFARDLRKFL